MTNAVAHQATPEAAMKALFMMFTCFNLGGSDLERKARHDAYWAALKGLAPFAVVAACRDAMQGNIGDGSFVPTAAMIYQRAIFHLPRETSKLPSFNDERYIEDDERERVKNGFIALKAALRGEDLTEKIGPLPSASIEVLRDIAATAADKIQSSQGEGSLGHWKKIGELPIAVGIDPSSPTLPQLSPELRGKLRFDTP